MFGLLCTAAALSDILAQPVYISNVDTDNDGAITIEELKASLLKSFAAFDGGFPFGADPVSAVSTAHSPLLKAHVKDFDHLDRNRDGKLTVTQFSEWIKANLDVPSSDLQTIDSLWHGALWSIQQFTNMCDPWNECMIFSDGMGRRLSGRVIPCNSQITDAHYTDPSYGGWEVCPVEVRSPSGCGDFMEDPRTERCLPGPTLLPYGTNHQYIAQPINRRASGHKQHRCFNQFLSHRDYNYHGLGVPPTTATHREMWAAWGAYKYLPPHRWLHNVEHGGAVFLYKACLDENGLCTLKSYISKLSSRIKLQTGDKFRWILTPYADLKHAIAIGVYGHVYLSDAYNELAMDKFIDTHYRWAYEDVPRDGSYDYLFLGTDLSCPASKLTDKGRAMQGVLSDTTTAIVLLGMLTLVMLHNTRKLHVMALIQV